MCGVILILDTFENTFFCYEKIAVLLRFVCFGFRL